MRDEESGRRMYHHRASAVPVAAEQPGLGVKSAARLGSRGRAA
ncbi:hypothetical protein [Streptomyces sp. NBC_00820]